MKQTVGWIAVLIVLVASLEIISFAVLTFIPQFQKLTYIPPNVTREHYETYIAERDPVLGWPSQSWLEKLASDRDARQSPANAALGPDASSCISVYGDSFAYSEEVTDSEAWTNILAKKFGCRVDNFGVGGYGADQAVLRLESHLKEGRNLGQTLILTMYPSNLNRHMNQWPGLLVNWPLTFKPAFHHNADGKIALSPIFDGNFETFQKLIKSPTAYLPAETYLPSQPGFFRKRTVGFPYSISLGAILLDQLQLFRGFHPAGTAYYNYPNYYDDPNGPSSEKIAITTHIIHEFARLCDMYSKHCVLVLTPDPEIVLQQSETGTHDLKSWISSAAKELIFLDATDIFTDLDDICAHLTRPLVCQGHYSPAGYARLAEFVALGLENVAGN